MPTDTTRPRAPVDADVLERIDREMSIARSRAREKGALTWENRLRAEALRRMTKLAGMDRQKAARDLLGALHTTPLGRERALERIVLMLRIAEATGSTPQLKQWIVEEETS